MQKETMSRFYQSQHYTSRRKAPIEGEWNRVMRKRVMVVIDQSMGAKHAMLWALTHVTNEGDVLTLLQVVHGDGTYSDHGGYQVPDLARSLGSLCNAMRPEVGTEALVIQGPKLTTVLALVKKLDVSVLVLRQSRPSSLCGMTKSRNEDFVEQCIENSECLTMSVRKRSSGVGGYLISTRWQKNFWLLA